MPAALAHMPLHGTLSTSPGACLGSLQRCLVSNHFQSLVGRVTGLTLGDGCVTSSSPSPHPSLTPWEGRGMPTKTGLHAGTFFASHFICGKKQVTLKKQKFLFPSADGNPLLPVVAKQITLGFMLPSAEGASRGTGCTLSSDALTLIGLRPRCTLTSLRLSGSCLAAADGWRLGLPGLTKDAAYLWAVVPAEPSRPVALAHIMAISGS